MKNILGIMLLSLLWCNSGFASEAGAVREAGTDQKCFDLFERKKIFQEKFLPKVKMSEGIFVTYIGCNKYYVFYKEMNDNFFWSSGISKATAKHIIIKRDDLTMVDYRNEWVKALRRNKKYTDVVIDKLFKESNGYIKSYEDILFSSGKTLKAQRSLDTYQCKKITTIKLKV